MSWVEFLSNARKLYDELVVFRTKYEHMEKQLDRLADAQERFMDKLVRENEELRGRVMKLEATVESALQLATRDAFLALAREQMEKHGPPPYMALAHTSSNAPDGEKSNGEDLGSTK